MPPTPEERARETARLVLTNLVILLGCLIYAFFESIVWELKDAARMGTLKGTTGFTARG
jgi:hypothetical protein